MAIHQSIIFTVAERDEPIDASDQYPSPMRFTLGSLLPVRMPEAGEYLNCRILRLTHEAEILPDAQQRHTWHVYLQQI